MKTFLLSKLRESLTTAPFEFDMASILNLDESDIADLMVNDVHIDAKFYPTLTSKQNLVIDGTPLSVSLAIDVAFFISLNESNNSLSGYLDEDHLFSLSENKIIFHGDNIAIISDDNEILTVPYNSPNTFIFNDEIKDTNIELSLPELEVETANSLFNSSIIDLYFANALNHALRLAKTI